MLDDKIKQRLRSLFNTAENDASAEGEIDNALRAAKIMMQQHQVTRDDVFQGDDGEMDLTNVRYSKVNRYSLYSSITEWEAYIARFVKEFVPTVGFYFQRGEMKVNAFGRQTGKCTRVVFYGPELDVTFAGEVFDEIFLFIHTAAKLKYGTALSRGDAASYAEGFTCGLWEANHKEDLKIQKRSDSMELMVVNQSLAIAEKGLSWLAEECGVSLRKGRGGTSAAGNNAGAYGQGLQAGKDYKPGTTKKAGLIRG